MKKKTQIAALRRLVRHYMDRVSALTPMHAHGRDLARERARSVGLEQKLAAARMACDSHELALRGAHAHGVTAGLQRAHRALIGRDARPNEDVADAITAHALALPHWIEPRRAVVGQRYLSRPSWDVITYDGAWPMGEEPWRVLPLDHLVVLPIEGERQLTQLAESDATIVRADLIDIYADRGGAVAAGPDRARPEPEVRCLSRDIGPESSC